MNALINEAPQNEFLTVNEVASLLRVTDRTVRTLIEKKIIPCHKLGGSIRFKRQEIDDWIEANRIAAGKVTVRQQ